MCGIGGNAEEGREEEEIEGREREKGEKHVKPEGERRKEEKETEGEK
jgi:hypothetical protein